VDETRTLNILISPLFLGHETGTLKKMDEIKLLVIDKLPPYEVMSTNHAEFLYLYESKHKLAGVFYKHTFRLSYGMRHGFTLSGSFSSPCAVGGNRFLVFLFDHRHTCRKGGCGSWMLYSAQHGKCEANVGRFCPGRPCHDSEGNIANQVHIYFDHLHSNQGIIIVSYKEGMLSGRNKKRSSLVSYKFVMVRGQLQRTELQTLVRGRIVPMEEKLDTFLSTFATPHHEKTKL
jgi:hypothetical protein